MKIHTLHSPESSSPIINTLVRRSMQFHRLQFCRYWVCAYADPLASGVPFVVVVVGIELVLLLAAAICQAGIFTPPAGAPVLNGLALRPWSDATASVPELVLTDAGRGVVFSVGESPAGVELLGVAIELIGAGDDGTAEL